MELTIPLNNSILITSSVPKNRLGVTLRKNYGSGFTLPLFFFSIALGLNPEQLKRKKSSTSNEIHRIPMKINTNEVIPHANNCQQKNL
jgi:hypothetical protein